MTRMCDTDISNLFDEGVISLPWPGYQLYIADAPFSCSAAVVRNTTGGLLLECILYVIRLY
jgi:hypothetical protein